MKDRIQELALVESQTEIAEGVYRIQFRSGALASRSRPGHFVNVLLRDTHAPLLRRPFSISSVAGESISLIYNVIGRGTRLLASKREGESLDVLGPLGMPFRVDETFETAVLVAGGLGVAPFPFLTELLVGKGKKVRTYLGARCAPQIVTQGLRDLRVATDDGSRGFHGTVVELLRRELRAERPPNMKIFSCGPTPMMKALSELAEREEIPCELSLEGDMACGIGLCQGCPVKRREGEKSYSLVCVEGPTFWSSEIILP